MPTSPGITLTIDLKDFTGAEIGSAANPAYVRIALCSYGALLPRIAGTSMIAKVGPTDIPYVGTPLVVTLFGNDQITPLGITYYSIALLDDKKNVLQSGAYIFNGTSSLDLSTQTPVFPSLPPNIQGGDVLVPFSGSPNFNCGQVRGPVTFELTLVADVTSSTVSNTFPGQIVIFSIRQDGVGSHGFVWATNVKNAGIVDGGVNVITTQAFVADRAGNLYPLGPQTYS